MFLVCSVQEDAGRSAFRGHNVTGDWFPQRHFHGNDYISFVIKFGTFPPHPKRHLTVHQVDEYNCLVAPLMCLLLWVGSLCGQLFLVFNEVLWPPAEAHRASIFSSLLIKDTLHIFGAFNGGAVPQDSRVLMKAFVFWTRHSRAIQNTVSDTESFPFALCLNQGHSS